MPFYSEGGGEQFNKKKPDSKSFSAPFLMRLKCSIHKLFFAIYLNFVDFSLNVFFQNNLMIMISEISHIKTY